MLLLLVKDARLTADLASGLPVTVLDLEVLICLRLVDLLLQIEDFLIVLICLLCVLVLRFLEVVVESLDFLVQVLLLCAEAVELALFTQGVLDVLSELPVREVSQLVIQELQTVNQVAFVIFDLFFVALHVWVVLELAAKGAC